MPVEGFVVEGAHESGFPDNSRSADEVSTDFTEVYSKIASRGGKIISKEVLLTPIHSGAVLANYRQDTHLIVDFPESV
jgi:hypothetical protein